MKTKMTRKEKREKLKEELNYNRPYQATWLCPYNIHNSESVVEFFRTHFRYSPITPKDGDSYIVFNQFLNDVLNFKIKSLSKDDVLEIRALKAFWDCANYN